MSSEEENMEFINNWISKMQKKYGHTVYAFGKAYDWGQMLCVNQYGLDSSKWADSPSSKDVEVAKDWLESGCPIIESTKEQANLNKIDEALAIGENQGLWFDANYASEAFLQQEFRKVLDILEEIQTAPLAYAVVDEKGGVRKVSIYKRTAESYMSEGDTFKTVRLVEEKL